MHWRTCLPTLVVLASWKQQKAAENFGTSSAASSKHNLALDKRKRRTRAREEGRAFSCVPVTIWGERVHTDIFVFWTWTASKRDIKIQRPSEATASVASHPIHLHTQRCAPAGAHSSFRLQLSGLDFRCEFWLAWSLSLTFSLSSNCGVTTRAVYIKPCSKPLPSVC